MPSTSTRESPSYQMVQRERAYYDTPSAYLFCSSSLASSSTSSGLSCGEGDESDVDEEVAVVCKDVGVATWLAIGLTV